MNVSRRSFLKTGMAAGTILTSAGLIPRIIYSAESAPEIKYRELGKTGWKVSEIGFGAMNTRDEELINAALDAGINFIDTAHGYMNGQNEEIIGRAAKSRRKQVFISTKLDVTRPEEFMPQLELSLKRLQTDYVDLLNVHRVVVMEDFPNDEVMKLYQDAKRKGMARFIGIATHSPEIMLDACVKSKLWDAVIFSYNYLSPQEVTPAVQRAREAGIATIAMKNLLNTNTPFDRMTLGDMQQQGGGHPEREPLGDIRREKIPGTKPQQALIKWVLNNKYVDTSINGMTAFEHLADDLRVMSLEFTFDTEKLLQQQGELIRGRYCRGVLGCNECEGQCPNGVSVPDINRCLGYAFGYGSMELARENYLRLPRDRGVEQCASCEQCAVKCVYGQNIDENIRRARALFC